MMRAAIMSAAVLAPQHLFSRLYDVTPYQKLLRDWITGIGLMPSSKIAEIGCGPGRLSVDLKAKGFRVTGSDRASAMIRAARRNGLKPSEAILADALNLPFEDALFDATVSASLINVVDDPKALLVEMLRVTRPEGFISCLFPGPTLQTLDLSTLISSKPLGFLDRELLKTWASLSRKFEAEIVLNWMQESGTHDANCQTFWDGRILAVSGRKPLNL